MLDQQAKTGEETKGSKLGLASGVVVTIAFFLPWVRACGTEMNGYAIATNRYGNIQESWVYWATLLAGLVCVALFLVLRTNTQGSRLAVATVRLIVGLVGFLPVVNIWVNVQRQGGAIEVLFGGWLTVLGYVGIVLSFFVDLSKPPGEQ